ncbi:MAG: hypothetical protein H7Y59_02745 [Anaerolineales bacterium]|nr:hypothetical protein [Anaerolineales bacterium]
MSSEERKKILQMVADGKISAEEAATLMRTLDESAEEEIEIIEADSGFSSEKPDAPEFEEVRRRASKFSKGFLGMGILVTVLSAWVMFAIQQNSGLNFWFFCFTMPFIVGIIFIALGGGSRSSRWLYLNVDRSKAEDGPKRISLALPLPLGLVGWFIKNFGSRIDRFKKTNIDEVINAINMAKTITEPLIINVDDDDDGERAQLFIG